jgi:transcriptional regulator with XRE-family HTH domain
MLRMTVAELARRAGVAPYTITRLEAGENLNGRTLTAIKTVFERGGIEFTSDQAPGLRVRS